MSRMLWAGLIALPLFFASTSTAQAQGCAGGDCGFGFAKAPFTGGSPFGCGAFCMKLFGTWHQDGPLFNYGPYAGYYPFEPYGPWTSDLRYTGPRGPLNNVGYGWNRLGNRGGCGLNLGLGRFAGLFNRGCNSCGSYPLQTLRNVFHRCHPYAGCGQTAVSTGGCYGER